MSWLRVGDTFNSQPEFMRAQELAVEREDAALPVLIKGWTMDLFTYSAQQFTDYYVTYGALVDRIGLIYAKQALDDLLAVGILTDVSTDSERKYKLVERESFIHLIKSTDKKMDAKRKRDRNKGTLQVPVLLRDGDQCRYCGIEVNWDDRRGDEGGTFDHREPEEETTPENYCVACRGCNKLRFELGPEADLELPMLDVPDEPIYGKSTRKQLVKWRRITARVCRQLGIPNPVEDSVEARTVPASSRATNQSVPTITPPVPTGSQPVSEPQFPVTPPPNGGFTGRAANEESRRPAASEGATIPSLKTTNQEPSRRQRERVPQGDTTSASAQAVRPAKGSTSPVRKRRQRRRRRG
ncbi:hypothetical protein [Corynebacterium sp.]|uniref:HNH endonuclease n=1 Tax=Corynebacterium sp. TaxID=1720 RepID=UPI0028ACC533|nr:hypothetical protein [Corynebacterium sp.]